MRVIGVLADRLLSLAAPRITAAAAPASCFNENCFCSTTTHTMWIRTCCIINNRFGCSTCFNSFTKC